MNLIEQLIEEEGFKPYAYTDSLGYLTIGHGILIEKGKGGITEGESRFLLQNRVDRIKLDLAKHLPWLNSLSEPRRDALVMMAYQMGMEGLRKFHDMLAALEAGDYAKAADEAMDSTWAKQTPARAFRVSELIRHGV